MAKGTVRPDAARLRAWRGFLTAHARLIPVLDAELQRADCVPLGWYDALLELRSAAGQRLRMQELAQRVLLSKSGMTRLVDRLVSAGLVDREAASADRRGAYAVLTEPGRAELRKAWPHYARGIVTHFATHASASEAAVLERVFGRITAALGGDAADSDP